MKKHTWSRVISASLCGIMVFLGVFQMLPATEAAAARERTIIDAFLEPSSTERPMVRMWFPDAYAGVDDNDTIEKQIQALYDAGFGGVEIAYLADGSNPKRQQSEGTAKSEMYTMIQVKQR